MLDTISFGGRMLCREDRVKGLKQQKAAWETLPSAAREYARFIWDWKPYANTAEELDRESMIETTKLLYRLCRAV